MARLRRPAAGHAGVTLAEMLVVVAIVGVLATVAVPRADPLGPFRVDAVAAELAHAVRFAQREAVRTGENHAVMVDQASQIIRLYRLTSIGVLREDLQKPVLHPIDKREYRLVLAHTPALGATIAGVTFNFAGGSVKSELMFDSAGMPLEIVGLAGEPGHPLQAGEVTIRHGQFERKVTIAPSTARVSF